MVRPAEALPRAPPRARPSRSPTRLWPNQKIRIGEATLELRRDGKTERIELEPQDSYRLELENLSDAIRGEAEPLLGLADAMAQARTIEALYQSAASGSRVAL